MGLRINTNVPALNSLRNLQLSERNQSRSLERLSSGLRINRGADDPSGIVISERLRAQIEALKQNTENSQNAANLVATADANLAKVTDLLIDVQDSIQFALSTGSSSPEQVAAEQDSVDQAIAAIDRIANTTRFGERALLNGNAQYQLSGSAGLASDSGGTAHVALHDVHFKAVNFAGTQTSRTLTLQLGRAAQRAEIHLDTPTVGAGSTVTMRITGARGSADVVLGSSATGAALASAVNAVAGQTGVYATNASAAVVFRSEGFGDTEFISIQNISGTLNIPASGAVRADDGTLTSASPALGTTFTAGEVISDRGLDAQITYNGVTYTATGLNFSINTREVSFDFQLNPDLYHHSPLASQTNLASATSAAGINLIVARTGLEFQLRESARPTDRMLVGLDSVTASELGKEISRDVISEISTGAANVQRFGFLSSVQSGQGNDLAQNAANALNIVQVAQEQITAARGFLGAVVGFNIEPNIDSLEVATENLSASLSTLRDLNFAEETANFTRTQVLFQSGIAALASARLVPQSVLQLLQ